MVFCRSSAAEVALASQPPMDALLEAPDEALQAALAAQPPAARARLRAALAKADPPDPRGASSGGGVFCAIITYDFKVQAECDAWFDHFVVAEDGWKLTAGFDGCRLCKLARSVENPCKVTFYEEWDSKEAFGKYSKYRGESGFMTKWLGVDRETGKWAKLQNEAPGFAGYTLVCG